MSQSHHKRKTVPKLRCRLCLQIIGDGETYRDEPREVGQYIHEDMETCIQKLGVAVSRLTE